MPEYRPNLREIVSEMAKDVGGSIGAAGKRISHNLSEFAIGFAHGGLEVSMLPYIVPSFYRINTLDDSQVLAKIGDGMESLLVFGNVTSWNTHPAPDSRGYGSFLGGLAGLGLTVAEAFGYWHLAREGYPTILALALPLATNAASGLYEHGANISKRLIEKHHKAASNA